MTKPLNPKIDAPVPSAQLNSRPSWNYWLVSRIIWLVAAMVAAVVMFLLFMRIAYR